MRCLQPVIFLTLRGYLQSVIFLPNTGTRQPQYILRNHQEQYPKAGPSLLVIADHARIA